jgi:hypothetical protein
VEIGGAKIVIAGVRRVVVVVIASQHERADEIDGQTDRGDERSPR